MKQKPNLFTGLFESQDNGAKLMQLHPVRSFG